MSDNAVLAIVGGIGVGGLLLLFILFAFFTHKERMAKIAKGEKVTDGY